MPSSNDHRRVLARNRKAEAQARWRARVRGEAVPRLKPGPKPRVKPPWEKEPEMKKAELEDAVAELMAALRWAVLAVNAERWRRRPRGENYAAPALGRKDLLAVERRVEKRKGGAS